MFTLQFRESASQCAGIKAPCRSIILPAPVIVGLQTPHPACLIARNKTHTHLRCSPFRNWRFMDKLPEHVAFIVDGNRRWARAKGLPTFFGHKAGFDRLEEITLDAVEIGIPYVSCFVFSTENFKRDKDEVSYLMKLFCDNFSRLENKLQQKNIRVVFSGRKSRLDRDVLDAMDSMEQKTLHCSRATANVCLNYGGQAEIVDACRKICDEQLLGRIRTADIDESLFEKYLYQQLPPIDLLIRTSGEIRLSNYMLWQLAYAELYFTKTPFPDFTIEEFEKALDQYSLRNRRFGGNTSESQ